MQWRPARLSVCMPHVIFPCTIKVYKISSGIGSPGSPGKTVVNQPHALCIQRLDTVGWVTGRTYGLYKDLCYLSVKILVWNKKKKTEGELANPASSGKWLLKWRRFLVMFKMCIIYVVKIFRMKPSPNSICNSHLT